MNAWVNNRDAGDLGGHRAHYDVTVTILWVQKALILCCEQLMPWHQDISSLNDDHLFNHPGVSSCQRVKLNQLCFHGMQIYHTEKHPGDRAVTCNEQYMPTYWLHMPLVQSQDVNSSPPGKIWLSFRRRYFHMHFAPINNNPALAPNKWQAIIWTNADSIYWRIYAALNLTMTCTLRMITGSISIISIAFQPLINQRVK